MDAEDFDELIGQAAQEPESFSADGQSVKGRSIDEIIKARDAVANRAAVGSRRSGWAGVIVAKGKTPGPGAQC